MVSYLLAAYKVSIARACSVVGLHRSMWYYQAKKDDSEVVAKLIELTEDLPTRGFDVYYNRIRTEGLVWNRKRVLRVYRGMKLGMRRRHKKRLPARTLEPLLQPIYANETWSMDFMHDVLSNGVKFRSFNVIDDFNRECLNLTLDTSINSKRVIRELDKLIAWRGMPSRIRVDNGPEYISHAMAEWAEERGIVLKFIQPGSPYQNGYVERFNKSYREEVLDAFSFTRIKEANALSQAWAWIYNNERPHKSLGYQPPITFAQQRLRSSAPSSLLPDQQYQWKSLLLNVTN